MYFDEFEKVFKSTLTHYYPRRKLLNSGVQLVSYYDELSNISRPLIGRFKGQWEIKVAKKGFIQLVPVVAS